jgi:16S rRNA (uracil1498-N3)-methyltransferase
VEAFDRDKVKLGVREAISAPAQRWQITLLQALPKGKIIESIIQKAAELGAFRIVPLLSERVVAASIGKKEAQAKTEKWRLIAVEAIKQCGSTWLPQIDSPITPKEFLARSEPFELPLVASPRQGARHAREYFRSFQTEHGRMPATVCVWVGPEGDFSPGEIDLITSKGALPISLGPLVLRSETAATYCLSILSYELQSTTGLD